MDRRGDRPVAPTEVNVVTVVPVRCHRHSVRLPTHDYTQPGAYFVTICTCNRECLFGDIVGGALVASVFGGIARDEWFRSADIRCEVVLHDSEFVVMPNHVHGIVRIVHNVGATGRSPLQTNDRAADPRNRLPEQHPGLPGPPSHSLGAVMAGYKASVTKRVNALRDMPGSPVWQRNYWEHVIRNEAELARIRQYIADNPARWTEDQLNPAAQSVRFCQE